MLCRLLRYCHVGMCTTWAAYATGCSRAEQTTSPAPSAERPCLSRKHASVVSANFWQSLLVMYPYDHYSQQGIKYQLLSRHCVMIDALVYLREHARELADIFGSDASKALLPDV